jgi:hypothetical protein
LVCARRTWSGETGTATVDCYPPCRSARALRRHGRMM